MGQKVTYRYYVGRLNMFEDKYEEAEKNLDYALAHCYKYSLRNKKRILNYLLPVKLLRGRLPTPSLLEKYKMHEFLPLGKSENKRKRKRTFLPKNINSTLLISFVFILSIVLFLSDHDGCITFTEVEGIRTGNLQIFNKGLVKSQELFIKYVCSIVYAML
jgi:hypothetical protein